MSHTRYVSPSLFVETCHRINNKSSSTFGDSFNMKRQLIIDAVGSRFKFSNSKKFEKSLKLLKQKIFLESSNFRHQSSLNLKNLTKSLKLL